MTDFTVTAEATDAFGRTVTGSATAVLLDNVPPSCGITETIEVRVDASRMLAFAELVERHAAAIRHDLEEFMAGEKPDGGFGWFRRGDSSGGSGM